MLTRKLKKCPQNRLRNINCQKSKIRSGDIISENSTKDCSSGTSASKIPTEDTHVKFDSVSGIYTESLDDHDNEQISESPIIDMSSPL